MFTNLVIPNLSVIKSFGMMGQILAQKTIMLSLPVLGVGGVRYKHSKKVNPRATKTHSDAIQYHGFSYYPRFPGEVDPPYEPTKLFMVKRIRSLSKKPYWERKWIAELHLDDRRKVTIVKNTPNNNALLYKVKHLIEIKPITFPYGMPDDPKHGFLKENGEFVSYNLLDTGTSELEEGQDQVKALRKLSVDGETLKKRLRLKWYSRWD